MEKRVIVAVVLCVAVMVVWQFVFPSSPLPPQKPVATAPAPSGGTAAPGTSPATTGVAVPGSVPAPPAVAGAAPAAAGAPAAAIDRPERRVQLETDHERFVFSSRGGTLLHAQLKGERFLTRKGDPTSGHDVVTLREPHAGELRTSFGGETPLPVPPDGAWETAQPTPDEVVFTAETPAVRIEKHFRVDKTRYRLHLDVVVRNKTGKSLDHNLALHIGGRQDPEGKGGSFLSVGTANPAHMLCELDEKTERHAIETLVKDKDPFNKTGSVRWIGTDEKFFLFAAVPYPERPPTPRTCSLTSPDGEVGEGILTFAGRALPVGGSTMYSFTVFAGPKVISDLENVRPGGEEAHLDDAVDVTLAVLSRPILSLLKFFHGFTHNWGLAIILLTLFIKLLTFYPTQKSLLSAKRMQKLAPKMAIIRKKYENDRQRQSVETMNLYKAHGVSPFGGCLPSLIQMPIWIALYSTLNYAVELYRAPFFAHIHDLTSADPFYITPLVMGVVMFLQMKMSPASPDNQQQAIMSVMMPVMFTGFSLFLPSGLALYMLTSYLIGILQQLYVNHVDRRGARA